MHTKRGGQAVVESMVALSVLAVGMIGIITLLSRSLGMYRVIVDQHTGTYLAAEAIEIAKNLVDAGAIQNKQWGEALPAGAYEIDYLTDLAVRPPRPLGDVSFARALQFDDRSGTYQYSAGESTRFRRWITVEYATADEMKVNAVVKWITRGGGEFDVDVEGHFFNWR